MYRLHGRVADQRLVTKPSRLPPGVLRGCPHRSARRFVQADFATQMCVQLRDAVRPQQRQRRGPGRWPGDPAPPPAPRPPASPRTGPRSLPAGPAAADRAGSAAPASHVEAAPAGPANGSTRGRCRARPPRRGPGAGSRWAAAWRRLPDRPPSIFHADRADPRTASSRRASARASAPIAGISAIPRNRAERYIPVPPHRIGKAAKSISARAAPAPPCRVARFRRRPHAIQNVRRRRFVRWRRPGGDDPQLAVALHGVGVDDRAAEPPGQRQRQRGFAAGGRPGDDDHRPLACRQHRPLSYQPAPWLISSRSWPTGKPDR